MGGVLGLTLDIGGTLLHPAEPVGASYARFAADFGVQVGADEAQRRFVAALRARPGAGAQVGDGRPFWRAVVAEATGSADEALFEALYAHYARPAAWTVAPGAREALAELRARGLRLAALSNWDTRLPGLLDALGFGETFHAVVCSGGVGVEKPDPRIFRAALAALGLPAAAVVHIGDSEREDLDPARAAGMGALLLRPDGPPLAALLRTL